jgi:hypothetical protein
MCTAHRKNGCSLTENSSNKDNVQYHGAVRFVDLRMLQRDVAKQQEGEIQERAFVDAVTNPYTQSCIFFSS